MEMLANWLQSFVGWLWELVLTVFEAITGWLRDFIVWILDGVFGAIAAAIGAIPVPAFLQTGLSGLFAGLDPSILYFLGQLKIPEMLTLIGSGVAFRLVRKLVTLGQW